MAAAACEWGRASPWFGQFASNWMHSQSWKRQGNHVQSPALHHAERWSEPSKSTQLISVWGFPGGSAVKNLPANARDVGLVPGSGRSLGVGNSNPVQYPGLGDPMDRGAWQAIVHGVVKSWTWFSNYTDISNIYLRIISGKENNGTKPNKNLQY